MDVIADGAADVLYTVPDFAQVGLVRADGSSVMFDVLDAPERILVADLSGVEFLGSAGLAVLVTAHERVEAPKALRIVASARETQRAFSMTGLNDLLDIYPSGDAALADT